MQGEGSNDGSMYTNTSGYIELIYSNNVSAAILPGANTVNYYGTDSVQIFGW